MLGVDILASVIIHAGTSSSQFTPPAGPVSVSVATSATGNFDNAVEVAFENGALGPLSANNFSGGILGGAQSTFGTASSPTRTTQTIVASATTYFNSWNANGQGGSNVLIGGFIRNHNFPSPPLNKHKWTVDSNTILSQSFSTGVSVSAHTTNNVRDNNQDNTFTTNQFGIYNQQGHSGGNGQLFGIRINHAAGRGASTLPQAGDSFSFRLSVSDVVPGVPPNVVIIQAIHDVTINFA